MNIEKKIKAIELSQAEALLEIEESRNRQLHAIDGQNHERPYHTVLLQGKIKKLNRELREL